MQQSGVSDLGVRNVQHLELGYPLKVSQPGVRDLRGMEVQFLELGQPFKTLPVRESVMRVSNRLSVCSCVNPFR